MVKKESQEGITVKKDADFSEWFTQVILKADFADYTKVGGCIVFKPNAWSIWEKIVDLVNERIKKLGVKNVYFPMFIPESLLVKEAKHVEGFTPEVAWVTHAGETKLNEKLAVRPTSEAIMYDSFSKWIRSWRDLPLKYNQWSNVVRWEFKHATPLLRTREFIFNEGHTVFSSKKEAEKEQDEILAMYKDICDNYLALPSLIGKKTDKEKFAGAEYTTSMEFMMPNGRAIQGPDFHHDGQNFSRAYDIKFLDESGKEDYAWQNTWAISTRMLGVMLAIHSDDKGLIMPPKMAENKIVIVPILFDDTKKKVLAEVDKIKKDLASFNPIVDDRDGYSAGWKFNEWELKGIPIRIEIGPKDLAKKQAIVVKRTGSKTTIKIKDLRKNISRFLDDIQKELYQRADKLLKSHITKADNMEELLKAVKNKKIALAPMCKNVACEDHVKEKTGGAKTLNMPLKQPPIKGKKCIWCKKQADYLVYVGKSY